MDCEATPEMLETIFFPNNAIHDGGVILKGDIAIGVSRHGGVTIYSVAQHALRAQVLRREIREFQPDWLLASSEDVGHILLREARAVEGAVGSDPIPEVRRPRE